jgi:DnaJ family protein C protein 3
MAQFWKRSIPYLQAQKFREALSDLNRALSLDSKHTGALLRRARIFKTVGKFEESITDLEKILKLSPNHKDALELLPSVRAADDKFQEASALIKAGNLEQGINILSGVLESAPTFEKGLLMRARASVKLGKWESVLEDMTHLLRATPTNTAALYLRGKAMLYGGDEETALTHYSQCLNYDAFDDDCKKAKDDLEKFRSSMEKANKALELTKFREASNIYLTLLEFDRNWVKMMPVIYEKLTRCYLGMNDGKKALEMVDLMISYDDKVQVSFILKGEAYLLLEEWDKAIQEMQNALNLGQTNEARQGLHKAEKMKKMALRKDYYKILEVPKTASKREISKAYRKLSMKYHPDKNTDSESEHMYRDVTEAYDILNDEEKRRKYDAGEDLNQPQQPQHGHPFNFFYGFQ